MMTHHFPKVSVIIPSYNQGNTIEDSICSVLAQQYPNLELIIIDGGSTDESLTIIQKYEEHLSAWITESDQGIYDAMNKGIIRATGEWIYFLGTDDVLYEGILTDVFSTPQNADLLYGNVCFKHSGNVYDGAFNTHKLTQKNICHQAIFYKKTLFEALGNFNLQYKLLADYVFNVRCFGNKQFKIKHIEKTIALYNEKGGSGNHLDLNFVRHQQRLFQENLGLNIPQKTIYQRVGKLGIQQMHQRNYKKGLRLIGMAFPYAPIFYLRTLLYFFKNSFFKTRS